MVAAPTLESRDPKRSWDGAGHPPPACPAALPAGRRVLSLRIKTCNLKPALAHTGLNRRWGGKIC